MCVVDKLLHRILSFLPPWSNRAHRATHAHVQLQSYLSQYRSLWTAKCGITESAMLACPWVSSHSALQHPTVIPCRSPPLSNPHCPPPPFTPPSLPLAHLPHAAHPLYDLDEHRGPVAKRLGEDLQQHALVVLVHQDAQFLNLPAGTRGGVQEGGTRNESGHAGC